MKRILSVVLTLAFGASVLLPVLSSEPAKAASANCYNNKYKAC